MSKQLHEETQLMTDEARHYIPLGKHFASHIDKPDKADNPINRGKIFFIDNV